MSDILNFSLDLGIIEGICHNQDIEVIPWRQDRLVVFASPDHALAKKARVSLEDLAKAGWVLRESGAGTKENF